MGRARELTQILTGSVHVGLQGSVNIADKADAGSTANVEDIADGRLIEDAATVGMLAAHFRHLQTEALAPADSLTAMMASAFADGTWALPWLAPRRPAAGLGSSGLPSAVP